MWSRLSMWVMAPSKAYRVDDRDGWVFFVADATQQPFQWKGINYTTGIAASAPAYLDCEAPPGTYVVWATLDDLTTHRAVVAVHDEPVVTVRLLPDAPPDTPPADGGDCEITIDKAEGRTTGDSTYPKKVTVTGTATDCPEVHVVVRSPRGGEVEGDVTTASDGSWEFTFTNTLEVTCGAVLLVEAWCVEDKRCRTRRELPIKCTKSRSKR